MKSPSNRRSRGRGGNSNRRSPQNTHNPNRSYESSGGGTRVRGNAQQLYEKYTALSRDAQSSGDYIGAENYAQHAEHYFRLMQAASAARAEKAERNEQQGGRGRRRERNGAAARNEMADAPQPRIGEEEKTAATGEAAPAAAEEAAPAAPVAVAED